MKKRLALAVSSSMLVLAVLVPAKALAARPATSSRTLALASSLRGTGNGAGGSPIGYLPLHPKQYALAKAAANARAGVGSNRPRGGGGGGAPIVSSYANASPSFTGQYQTQLTPPDSTGTIGPDRYIEAINTKYAIYSKTGSLINSGSLSQLTGISGGLFGYNLSDPQMMWDQRTQRFYYSVVYYNGAATTNGLAIGWSTTSTPASSSDFCKYTASFGGELPDYPKLGDSQDFLLFGYNLFGNGASTYDGSEFMTLNKPPAGSTCAATSLFALHFSSDANQLNGVLRNGDHSLAATPVPARLVDDSNGTGYVVANADLSTVSSANFISVYSVTTNGTDSNGIIKPAITGPKTVTVGSYSMPSNAPEKGTTALIDTLDGRFEAAMAAVDPTAGGIAIWTAHAVFGTNSGIGAEERWYEINPSGSGSLYDIGKASSASLFIWNGAISSDRNGSGSFGHSWAMSVSTSSSTTYPAIQFMWKLAGSASTPTLTNLVQATGPNVDFSCSPCRWGDYSGASPDPTASGTVGKVWLANQYNVASSTNSDTDWRTWIFGVTPT
jgi:hypothetical protein